ncbi:quinone-dependent dihydroorotate dehydrogenase [Candidatus Woesebacteria bacterium]|nr:quinone-dependent dihydroorotate dehydrogenase [Candidatus Woesebacteria bacterium]
MNKIIFSSLLIIMLSLVGLTDASYLTYQRAFNIIPPCIPGFQCETVLRSPYANIGVIPLSALGILYYSIVLFLGILVYLESPLPSWLGLKRSKITTLDALQITTTFGLFFSAYLITLMSVVIKAWCTYCLISAIACLLLFLVGRWHARLVRRGDSIFLKGLWLSLCKLGYQHIGKPLFFLADPERVHNTAVRFGVAAGNNSLLKRLTSSILGFHTPATRKQFAGITFPNAVGLAAGFDYNGSLTGILPSVGFGWHTIGTVTLESYEGNEKPRLTRFPHSKSILVNKGLKNIGAEKIIAKLSKLTFSIPTGISIASTNKSFESDKAQILDIARCFLLFERSPLQHSYYELNISCPNTHGGEPFTTAKRLEILLTVLDPIVRKPIFVKLPIDLPDQDFMSLLRVCSKHSIAGLIIGNLTKDKKNPDIEQSERQRWNSMSGNLSGKPTFARSNRLIKMADAEYGNRFVIVGTGGIFSPEDAEEKLKAGADLVQLITGMIYEGPQLIGSINRKLTSRNRADTSTK